MFRAPSNLQIDTLHPWGDEEVAWTWSRAERDRDTILVGLVRKALLAITKRFSPKRVLGWRPSPSPRPPFMRRCASGAPRPLPFFVSRHDDRRGRTEVYGESEPPAPFTRRSSRCRRNARWPLRAPNCGSTPAIGRVYSRRSSAHSHAALLPNLPRSPGRPLWPAPRRSSPASPTCCRPNAAHRTCACSFWLPAALGASCCWRLIVGDSSFFRPSNRSATSTDLNAAARSASSPRRCARRSLERRIAVGPRQNRGPRRFPPPPAGRSRRAQRTVAPASAAGLDQLHRNLSRFRRHRRRGRPGCAAA